VFSSERSLAEARPQPLRRGANARRRLGTGWPLLHALTPTGCRPRPSLAAARRNRTRRGVPRSRS